MSVHLEMAFWWTLALQKGPQVPSEFHTVRGAWRYVCRATQWNPSDPQPNVSRSVYWPECSADYIYGYGPQTDPDADPTDPTEQADLLEDDQFAAPLE